MKDNNKLSTWYCNRKAMGMQGIVQLGLLALATLVGIGILSKVITTWT